MAYKNASRSGLRQTSVNAATTLAAALVRVGILADRESVADYVNQTMDDIFRDLLEQYEADEKKAAEDAANKPARGGNRGGQGSSGGSKQYDPGTLVLKDAFGRHGGKTIAHVYAEDPDYVVWLAEECNNSFVSERAKKYLAQVGHVSPPANYLP